MNIRKHIAGVSVALALFVGSIFGQAAVAQTTTNSETTAKITITGGAFTVNITGGDFGSLVYSFAAQNDTTGFTLSATDARGTGVGWNIQISATDFQGATYDFPISNLALAHVSSNSTGGDAVGPIIESNVTLANTQQKIVSAPVDEGEGSYTFEYNGNLTVPAQTRVDAYESDVTVDLASAP